MFLVRWLFDNETASWDAIYAERGLLQGAQADLPPAFGSFRRSRWYRDRCWTLLLCIHRVAPGLRLPLDLLLIIMGSSSPLYRLDSSPTRSSRWRLYSSHLPLSYEFMRGNRRISYWKREYPRPRAEENVSCSVSDDRVSVLWYVWFRAGSIPRLVGDQVQVIEHSQLAALQSDLGLSALAPATLLRLFWGVFEKGTEALPFRASGLYQLEEIIRHFNGTASRTARPSRTSTLVDTLQ